ncbi:ATP-dependent DNA helicase [Mycena amicta]|nr:ATP-dependent DNA helicase [Mycena amicta]
MSQDPTIPGINWRANDTSTPTRPFRPPAHLTQRPTVLASPGNPLAPVKHRKQHRNGYEQTPKTPSFQPFALNNPGAPNQRAFERSTSTHLAAISALNPAQWNQLAHDSSAIPKSAELRSFQIQITNLVLMRRGDATVISATGSGKSLSWTLPLLARQEGISLVITPFTSLGRDGEQSNSCDGLTSLFIYSEQNTPQDFEKAASGEMLVIYVCPEMLESPSFARLLHSKSWCGRLSGIYIDEAHLVYQSHVWRPSYSRLYHLRNIVGHDIPLICLSATCPALYRAALVTYTGLSPDYTLINLGNFLPELSTIILPFQHDVNTFLDLAFIIPLGSRESDLAKMKTLVYSNDLDMLTEMFWWGFSRVSSMQIPTRAINIIHLGLSAQHQDLCLQDFRDGPTSILFGSSKISAGINFSGVRHIIQHKVRGLSVADIDQRRGRGARRKGESSVMLILVEPSMQKGSDVSIEHPGDQDPGIVELVQCNLCAELIIQRQLDNPPFLRHDSFACCNRCDPSLHPGREYRWVEVNPAPSATGVKSTTAQCEVIFDKLVLWRLEHWWMNWRDGWPSYGPKSLVSDSDLENLAAHAAKIFSVEDMRHYTHILHWTKLSTPLFDRLQEICQELSLLSTKATEEMQVDEPQPKRRKTAQNKKPEVLQEGEMIIDF